MWQKFIIEQAFKLLTKFLIDKISFDPLKKVVEKDLQLVQNIASVLTDKDPDNKTQLEKVFQNYSVNRQRDFEAQLVERGTLSNAAAIVRKSVTEPVVSEYLAEQIETVEVLQLGKVTTKRDVKKVKTFLEGNLKEMQVQRAKKIDSKKANQKNLAVKTVSNMPAIPGMPKI